jgi:hypothetical protein
VLRALMTGLRVQNSSNFLKKFPSFPEIQVGRFLESERNKQEIWNPPTQIKNVLKNELRK